MRMKNQLEITKVIRGSLEKIAKRYPLEKLNEIPPGFSNNLIWNIAHIIVTQQLLVYNLSGLPMMVSKEMVETYKKGTKTERPCTQEEVDEIIELLQVSIEKTEQDLDHEIFKSYTVHKTSPGFEIRNVGDALAFNNFHEGIHLGYILALKKAL